MTFVPVHETVFLREGRRAVGLPVSGLFWRADGPAPADAIVRARVGGQSVALTRVDGERWLDLARLCRALPYMLAELATRLGFDGAVAALAAEPLVRPLEAMQEVIEELKALVDDLHLPALWLEDPQVGRARDASALAAAPDVISITLRWPAGTIEVVGLRDAWVERVERGEGRAPRPHPCAIARAAGQVYAGDLGAAEAAALGARLGAAVEPEAARPWSAQELAETAALAINVHEHGGDLAGYFRAVDPLPPAGDLDEAGRRVLGGLFMLQGLALRETDPAAAVAKQDRALELAGDDGQRQDVLYNRGYARLATTAPELGRTIGASARVRAGAFPQRPTEEHLATWRLALADFEEAARLDDADATAWSQVGMASELLARGPERAARLAVARAAFEKAAERLEGGELREVMRANAERVARDLELPPAPSEPAARGAPAQKAPDMTAAYALLGALALLAIGLAIVFAIMARR